MTRTTLPVPPPTTLTDYEQIGFATSANLSDGHAYQDLSPGQSDVVARLAELWSTSEAMSVPESERLYLNRYAGLIGSAHLGSAAAHLVLPTASNSIDLVASYLALRGDRVLLTHPTFDNLALILRRRGVTPHPITEDRLTGDLAPVLAGADVLFLVTPNNPTGGHLERERFEQIVLTCQRLGVILVVDASFRLFQPQDWDTYQVLLDSGVSFIVFEDTGKVFPTQDMKASLLACSADHGAALRELYNEIYLCVSKFSLAVLGEFFDDARREGLDRSVRALVARRRARLRGALGDHVVDPAAVGSRISVEWLSTGGRSDLRVTAELRERGLGVLPGRGFFWDRAAGDTAGTGNVRVSLMKPEAEFDRGLEILAAYAAEVLHR
ncbi:aminotransferase class I/II-fold pyridoxal phosphate-dependent enzyme [Umezawaea sp. NPDC059074]|uniref:aminotransferase class I/II-fold pyridoxal phosphate-dependent enzyme n=1 Tax=Umezawaea sp. NPDC059074 TaxID=3346716 RepID=UPI0036C0A106